MFRRIATGAPARPAVVMSIDGVRVDAEQGEPVAAVLLRTPPFVSRTTPVTGRPRAPFCMMGACFDCLAEIDGQPSVRSCLVRAADGMAVRRQRGGPASAEAS